MQAKRLSPLLRRVALGLLLLLSPLLAAELGAQQLPRPVGFVNDYAGLVSAGDAARIEGVIQAVRSATGAEIAVVTVDSYQPFGSIEQFGVALAESWGVGAAGEDSGAILILAMQEREVRIEVGYGLEGILPDGRVGAILDQLVLPEFREGRWGGGLLAGVQGLAGYIAEEYDVDLSEHGAQRPRTASGSTPATALDSIAELLWILLVISVIGGRLFWPLLFLGSRRRGYYGGGFGTTSRSGRSTGFGSSGGSFGGFGGGGFGGGGSSRRF